MIHSRCFSLSKDRVQRLLWLVNFSMSRGKSQQPRHLLVHRLDVSLPVSPLVGHTKMGVSSVKVDLEYVPGKRLKKHATK